MHKILVNLPGKTKARLEREARRRRKTTAAFAGELLTAALEIQQPTAYDLMKDGCGIVATGAGDLSTNPKHLECLGA